MMMAVNYSMIGVVTIMCIILHLEMETVHAKAINSTGGHRERCKFPRNWKGIWYQNGLGEFTIKSRSIDGKGQCEDTQGNYYLVKNKESDCVRCLLFFERHNNILQYRESYCVPPGPLKSICSQIMVETKMYTLVKDAWESCSDYDAQQCMNPITDFGHELGISDIVAYFPIYKLNATQLSEYCDYGEKAGTCLDNLWGCEHAQVQLIHGFLDSFQFLCEESLEDAWESCSDYDAQQCMNPITDFGHELGISDIVAYFPLYKLNATQLSEYCDYGEKAGTCLDNLWGCEDAQVQLIHGFLDSFQFLCEESLEEYKTYQQCYGRREVVAGLQECDHRSLNQFSSFDPNEFGAKEHLCGIVKDDFSCVRNAVEPVCGKNAADWEVQYVRKVITPMLTFIGCSEIPQWAIWVMIGLSCFIIGVLFKVVFIMIARRKAAAARREARDGGIDDQHFNNALNKSEEDQPPFPDPEFQPPPYEQVGGDGSKVV